MPWIASRTNPVSRYASAQSPACETTADPMLATSRATPGHPATEAPDPHPATHGPATAAAATAESVACDVTDRIRDRRVAIPSARTMTSLNTNSTTPRP